MTPCCRLLPGFADRRSLQVELRRDEMIEHAMQCCAGLIFEPFHFLYLALKFGVVAQFAKSGIVLQ